MKLTVRDVNETTAYIHYKVDMPTFPSGSKETSERFFITVGNQPEIETKTANTGTVCVTNLERGKAQQVYGSAKIKKYYKTERIVLGADGKYTTEDVEHIEWEYEDTSVWVYTHPGPFHFNASSDPKSSNNIIANVLTKEKITNWLNHYKKVFYWYYKDDNDESRNKYLQKLTQTINESLENEIITAKWYNACIEAMGKIGKTYSSVIGGANGTVISAELINILDFNGTG